MLLHHTRYGSLQDVDETLKKLRASAPSEAMLVEEVGPEEIAGVVSKWTGGCWQGMCSFLTQQIEPQCVDSCM
jgi:hypothetical protein